MQRSASRARRGSPCRSDDRPWAREKVSTLMVAAAEQAGAEEEVEQRQDAGQRGGDVGPGRGLQHAGDDRLLLGPDQAGPQRGRLAPVPERRRFTCSSSPGPAGACKPASKKKNGRAIEHGPPAAHRDEAGLISTGHRSRRDHTRHSGCDRRRSRYYGSDRDRHGQRSRHRRGPRAAGPH